jgi:DNA ligase-1
MITLVNVIWAQDPVELDSYYEYVLRKGFEGVMIRKLGISSDKETESTYKPGQRCNNILKLKPIMDEEALVVGVVGASGREKEKALLKVKDIRGNVFLTRPAADFKLREKWFHNPELIMNKVVTIEFDSLSEKGVPRQPRSKGFRDYE